jgi:hypothetical protein
LQPHYVARMASRADEHGERIGGDAKCRVFGLA